MHKNILRNLIAVVLIAVNIIMLSCPSFALTSNGYIYELSDGGAVITGYSGTSAKLSVPNTLGGKKVVAISDGAFANNKSITDVTVPSGVSEIGENAFLNCSKLAKISLSDTVMHIGENAFLGTAYYNNTANWKIRPNTSSGGVQIGGSGSQDSIEWEDLCATELEYLYLGHSLIKIKVKGSYDIKIGTTVIADGAFSGNSGLKSVKIPSSVKTVGKNSFYGCSSLKSIHFSDGIENVGDCAFENCTSLSKIELPEKILYIGRDAFLNTEYYSNKNNRSGSDLFIGKYLIDAGNQKETVVSDETLYIADGVFKGKSAVIPQNVCFISKDAFLQKENRVVFGYEGSYAQKWSEENGIEFVGLETLMNGDMDFDGVLTANDYAIVCECANSADFPTYTQKKTGDMNYDGAVDVFDAITLDLMLNDMLSFVKGDADGDGKIDRDDYDRLVDRVTGRIVADEYYANERSDLNGDGAVDIFDAIALDLYLNGCVEL